MIFVLDAGVRDNSLLLEMGVFQMVIFEFLVLIKVIGSKKIKI
jgi:hypothetical protein